MGRIRATSLADFRFRPRDDWDRRAQMLELVREAVIGLQSLPGGDDEGGSAEFSALAGEALSGHRAVYVGDDGLAWYASKASASAVRVAGITTGAASLGAAATIQPEGLLTEPSWTWSGNTPVWLGTAGQLTQSPPTTGYLVQIGVAVGPTSLLIQPHLVARLT